MVAPALGQNTTCEDTLLRYAHGKKCYIVLRAERRRETGRKYGRNEEGPEDIQLQKEPV